jgi:pimeloyl-ACP methyl ester carboxylesterase
MLAIILLQVECVLGLSIIELSQSACNSKSELFSDKLTMPVLALGAASIPVLGGNITMPTIIYGMQQLAENVQGIKVPNSGHFIAEEQPQFVINQLSNFFGGNSTK